MCVSLDRNDNIDTAQTDTQTHNHTTHYAYGYMREVMNMNFL